MSFIEIIIIAFGLAGDAFAVSVCAGATSASKSIRSMVRISFHFGLFQFLMPIIGWLAGLTIVSYVAEFDHWIAFALLLWVGVHMINSSRKGENISIGQDPSKGIMLVALSVATSLDALAVGLSLAMLQVSIWYPSVLIGAITGITSFIGVLLGRKLSKRFSKSAAYIGGVLLILIGIRILIAHILFI